jgi:hypothetical protein
MAGGTAGDIRTPWPKGDDSIQLLRVGPFTYTGGTTAQVSNLTLPFSCKPVYMEITGVSTVAGGGTNHAVLIQDDTASTTKKWFNSTNVALAALGVRALTIIDKTVEFFAGAVMSATITPDNNANALSNVMVNVWVKPTH